MIAWDANSFIKRSNLTQKILRIKLKKCKYWGLNLILGQKIHIYRALMGSVNLGTVKGEVK